MGGGGGGEEEEEEGSIYDQKGRTHVDTWRLQEKKKLEKFDDHSRMTERETKQPRVPRPVLFVGRAFMPAAKSANVWQIDITTRLGLKPHLSS